MLKEIIEDAETIHSLSDKINDYLTLMFSEGVMTEHQANESARLMYILCDIDRIGQLCKEITEQIEAIVHDMLRDYLKL